MTFRKIPLILAASALTLVAACEQTGPNQYQKTQQGAAIGAGTGALLGILANRDGSVKDRQRGALVGAAILGGVGAGIGNSLDRQAEDLRRQLRSDIGVSNNGTNLVVVLSQDLLFATDSAQVSSLSQNELRIVANSLNQYPDTTVNVIGHTDNVGDANYNQGLSERRAEAVASILRGGGVASNRIRTIGAGESSPIASNLNAAGRQMNRRVEIIITPN